MPLGPLLPCGDNRLNPQPLTLNSQLENYHPLISSLNNSASEGPISATSLLTLLPSSSLSLTPLPFAHSRNASAAPSKSIASISARSGDLPSRPFTLSFDSIWISPRALIEYCSAVSSSISLSS